MARTTPLLLPLKHVVPPCTNADSFPLVLPPPRVSLRISAALLVSRKAPPPFVVSGEHHSVVKLSHPILVFNPFSPGFFEVLPRPREFQTFFTKKKGPLNLPQAAYNLLWKHFINLDSRKAPTVLKKCFKPPEYISQLFSWTHLSGVKQRGSPFSSLPGAPFNARGNFSGPHS